MWSVYTIIDYLNIQCNETVSQLNHDYINVGLLVKIILRGIQSNYNSL